MSNYYYVDLIAFIFPILSALFPSLYKRLCKKPPYSNSDAFSFLKKVLAATLGIELVLGVVLFFLYFSDFIMFFAILVLEFLLLSASFDSITKSNGDKTIFVHHVGKLVKNLLEAIVIVAGSRLIVSFISTSHSVYVFLLPVALYYGIKLLINRNHRSSKSIAESCLKEMEAQGVRICPECEGTVKDSERFCPKCHHKM